QGHSFHSTFITTEAQRHRESRTIETKAMIGEQHIRHSLDSLCLRVSVVHSLLISHSSSTRNATVSHSSRRRMAVRASSSSRRPHGLVMAYKSDPSCSG